MKRRRLAKSPAVRSEVDDLGGLVLADWDGDLYRRAEQRALTPLGKTLPIECWTPSEIDDKRDTRIGRPLLSALRELSEVFAAKRARRERATRVPLERYALQSGVPI